MDRTKAQKLLEVYGTPKVNLGKTTLVFARQNLSDIEEIETMETEQLIERWKSLVFINEIYGQVSLNDMQRISLIELELDSRKIPPEPLKEWYETAKADFEKEPF